MLHQMMHTKIKPGQNNKLRTELDEIDWIILVLIKVNIENRLLFTQGQTI